MAVHKLNLGEFDEIDYYLIAIHTSLEDYRLAFFINQILPIRLAKSNNEIQIHIKEGETSFARYHHYDSENDINWDLIQNKNEVVLKKTSPISELFSDQAMVSSKKVFLLPEFKTVDYFLKIENTPEHTIDLPQIKSKLNAINNISTVYTIETNQIKSKNNLIF
ncbi:IPExxxVDY family protein [Flavobacterium crassostreae]|uniref:IPExxxVDY family protein n=1 Tax=Flavobacterium crassostreae TaxID=1763534 RepID=A0A1B9E5V1_9FLAO|nr:IPExxxVDY family protein [Flavobacterium crassostreae]OCB77317.1 hypothetical protein LPBF_04810 [Flavobacterium crassostreae]